MAKRLSKNEKVAIKLSELLNDLTLDIEQIGYYIGAEAENVSYRRLQEVMEAARFEKEERYHGTNPLF